MVLQLNSFGIKSAGEIIKREEGASEMWRRGKSGGYYLKTAMAQSHCTYRREVVTAQKWIIREI